MTFDVAIIGGGVVGLAAAKRAADRGASVVLYDRHDAGRATDAGAGIVAPAVNTRDLDPWRDLAGAAARAYPELIAALDADDDADHGYERVGLLVVAVADDEVDRFRHVEELILGRQRDRGHPTGHTVESIDPDEARRRYPVLGEVRHALLDGGAARVDGRKLAAALLRSVTMAGVEVRPTPVDDLAAVEAEAEAVVIAGGAWSPAFGTQLGVQVPVEPQRGQIAHVRVPAEIGDTARWPMLSPMGDQYQVPWPGGRIAAGATRETGSGYAATTTVAGVRAVLDEAVRVTPGLAPAELLEVRVGLRPVTPDLLPVLDRVPGRPSVVVATGHGPTGLTLGPYSGGLAADLALGGGVDHDLTPFALTRDFDPSNRVGR